LIYLRETARAITDKFWSFAGSTLTVFLAALLAGSFALVVKNTGIMIEKIKSQASVEIYLKPDIDSLARERLHDLLVANKYVLGANYISKDKALYRLRDIFGVEMVRGISSNPLPESFELTLDADVYEGTAYQKLVDSLRVLPGVDDVGYVPGVVARLKLMFRVISILGMAIGIMVILACGFIIGNTVGVAVANRHITFYVMRLVGAKSIFVRFPYLLVGLFIGLIGTSLSIIALQIGVRYLARLTISISFMDFREIGCFIMAGGIIGLMGSHLALRKYIGL
jgi:cell division transport system permease protein